MRPGMAAPRYPEYPDRRRYDPMDEDRFNMAVRKFLKQVGVTSQREIEKVVRDGQVEGHVLKVRMTLTAENAPLEHVVEATIEF
jgi:Family of unknown function (DUF6494)